MQMLDVMLRELVETARLHTPVAVKDQAGSTCFTWANGEAKEIKTHRNPEYCEGFAAQQNKTEWEKQRINSRCPQNAAIPKAEAYSML